MRNTKFALMAQVLLSACNASLLRTGDATTDALIEDLVPRRANPEPRPRPVPTYTVYDKKPDRRVADHKHVSKRAANAASRKAKKASQRRNRK